MSKVCCVTALARGPINNKDRMIKNPSRIARNVTDDSPLIENLKGREQVGNNGNVQKEGGKEKGRGGMHSSD